MTRSAHAPSGPVDSHPAIQRFHQLESLVETLMASWLDSGKPVHNRRAHRVRCRVQFVIIPVNEAGDEHLGESSIATAWDISASGISFTHERPILSRMIVATFTQPDGPRESILTRLSWCRFTRDQRYRSGGKFVRLLDAEFAERIVDEGVPADASPRKNASA